MWQYHYSNPDDYIEHHGILGMKWGVRRYQNKDGSLTALGRHRINQGVRSEYKAEYNKRASAEAITKYGKNSQRRKYEKNLEKSRQIQKEFSQKDIAEARKKIAKFRNRAARVNVAFGTAGKYVGAGANAINALSGTALMLTGLGIANPALVGMGIANVGTAIGGGILDWKLSDINNSAYIRTAERYRKDR